MAASFPGLRRRSADEAEVTKKEQAHSPGEKKLEHSRRTEDVPMAVTSTWCLSGEVRASHAPSGSGGSVAATGNPRRSCVEAGSGRRVVRTRAPATRTTTR